MVSYCFLWIFVLKCSFNDLISTKYLLSEKRESEI